MDNAISITEIITGVGGIITALLVVAGIVVRFTKTKKDDKVFEDVSNIVKPVVEALDTKKPKI